MSIERVAGEARREQIVEAALELMGKQGAAGLNMAVLARRIGVAPSAIYRHFASKDQILDGVLELLRKRLIGNVSIVRSQAADPLDQLKRLLILHLRLILEHRALPRIIFSGDIYSSSPERKEKTFGIVESYLQEVAEIIREGQKGGRIRPELAPEILSIVFLGLIQPVAILWDLSDGKFDAAKQVEKAWPLFYSAVRAAG